jgi:hypothetical protein
MEPLTDAHRRRLAGLLRRLLSDVPSDQENAVRALRAAGDLFHGAINEVEKGANGSKLSQADMERVYRAGYQDGIRKAEDAHHGTETFRDVDGNVTWQTKALFCQDHADRLEERHKQFVADMAAKTSNDNWGRGLTPKQEAYLTSLYFKLGGKP